MRNTLKCWLMKSAIILATALLLQTTVFAACFRTPAEALKAGIDGTFQSAALDLEGYRVAMIQTDALLGRRWAKIIDCAHPGWPAVEIAVPEQVTSAALHANGDVSEPLPLVVRAGQRVHLWLQEDVSRIEATGVTEQSGVIGGRVTVRIANNSSDGLRFRELKGIVRAPAEVELLP